MGVEQASRRRRRWPPVEVPEPVLEESSAGSRCASSRTASGCAASTRSASASCGASATARPGCGSRSATPPAPPRRSAGRRRRRSTRSAAAARAVHVTGIFESASAGGRRSRSPSCARPSRDEFEPETWRPSPRSRWSARGRPARSCWRRSRTPSSAAARPLLRRGLGDLAPVPRRAGGEDLPPGLPPRAARAHALGRPGGLAPPPTSSPGIDRDVAVTGALLHDIGKTDAYNDDPLAIDLTDAGRLQGEIPLGYYTVRRADRGHPRLRPRPRPGVLHIILSHHGSLEHGSPVVPATREAVLVHMIDNLGGRLGSFDRLERNLPAGESWSGFDRALSARPTSASASARVRRAPQPPCGRLTCVQRWIVALLGRWMHLTSFFGLPCDSTTWNAFER